MRLYEIAIASYLFSKVVDFDTSLGALRKAVEGCVEISRPDHRKALLVWLNKWGCRQFAVDQHDDASEQILSWYEQHSQSLPRMGVDLWLATHAQLDLAATIYDDLAQRIACRRKNSSQVRIGPVGAAKILFALRPRFFLPWDRPIQQHLGFDGSAASYRAFLGDMKANMLRLAAECEQHGFSLSNLPDRLDRSQGTVPKLLDEFYWITITRGVKLPSPTMMQQRLEWSQTMPPFQ
jgi:hypothetical protein